MAISPWVVGETRPTWAITWLDDSKSPINLTGATITIRFAPVGGAGYAGENAPIISNATAGQFTYEVGATDMPAPGNYLVQWSATYGDATVLNSDPVQVTAEAAV